MSGPADGKWVVSESDERFTGSDTFDTREAAIFFGCGEHLNEFYVGQCRRLTYAQIVKGLGGGEYQIERIAEAAFELVGEVAEGWPQVELKDEERLDEMLEATFAAWLHYTLGDIGPKFWQVVNLERVEPKQYIQLVEHAP